MAAEFEFGDSQGLRVADLENRLIAIHITDVELGKETKHGTKDAVRADVHEIRTDGTVELLDEILFVQDVLAADLIAAYKRGTDWVVTRIFRPGQAWLFQSPREDEHEFVNTAMAKFRNAEPVDTADNKPSADDDGPF